MMNLIMQSAAAWHDYPTNYSGNLSVTGIGTLFEYAGTVTGDNFGLILLSVIGFIGFFSLKAAGFPMSKAFTSVLFGLFLISTYLLMAGLVNFWVTGIIGLIALVVAIAIRNDSQYGL